MNQLYTYTTVYILQMMIMGTRSEQNILLECNPMNRECLQDNFQMGLEESAFLNNYIFDKNNLDRPNILLNLADQQITTTFQKEIELEQYYAQYSIFFYDESYQIQDFLDQQLKEEQFISFFFQYTGNTTLLQFTIEGYADQYSLKIFNERLVIADQLQKIVFNEKIDQLKLNHYHYFYFYYSLQNSDSIEINLIQQIFRINILDDIIQKEKIIKQIQEQEENVEQEKEEQEQEQEENEENEDQEEQDENEENEEQDQFDLNIPIKFSIELDQDRVTFITKSNIVQENHPGLIFYYTKKIVQSYISFAEIFEMQNGWVDSLKIVDTIKEKVFLTPKFEKIYDIDWITCKNCQESCYINLREQAYNRGCAFLDELINVNNIEGSEFSDTLVGNDKDNKINGLDGNDFIRITLGKDEIDGGKGKNYINSFKYNDCRINADLTGEEYTTICEEDKDNQVIITKTINIIGLYDSIYDDSLIGNQYSTTEFHSSSGNDYIQGFTEKDLLSFERRQSAIRDTLQQDDEIKINFDNENIVTAINITYFELNGLDNTFHFSSQTVSSLKVSCGIQDLKLNEQLNNQIEFTNYTELVIDLQEEKFTCIQMNDDNKLSKEGKLVGFTDVVIYTAKVRGNEKNNKFIIKGGKNDIDGNQGNNNTIEIIYKQPSDVYLVENKIQARNTTTTFQNIQNIILGPDDDYLFFGPNCQLLDGQNGQDTVTFIREENGLEMQNLSNQYDELYYFGMIIKNFEIFEGTPNSDYIKLPNIFREVKGTFGNDTYEGNMEVFNYASIEYEMIYNSRMNTITIIQENYKDIQQISPNIKNLLGSNNQNRIIVDDLLKNGFSYFQGSSKVVVVMNNAIQKNIDFQINEEIEFLFVNNQSKSRITGKQSQILLNFTALTKTEFCFINMCEIKKTNLVYEFQDVKFELDNQAATPSIKLYCEPGYFQAENDNQYYCEKCPLPCKSCNNQDQCTSCFNFANLTDSMCKCIDNYQLQEKYPYCQGINQIQLCDPICQTCSFIASNCTSCNISYNRQLNDQNQCLCKEGYQSFKNSNNCYEIDNQEKVDFSVKYQKYLEFTFTFTHSLINISSLDLLENIHIEFQLQNQTSFYLNPKNVYEKFFKVEKNQINDTIFVYKIIPFYSVQNITFILNFELIPLHFDKQIQTRYYGQQEFKFNLEQMIEVDKMDYFIEFIINTIQSMRHPDQKEIRQTLDFLADFGLAALIINLTQPIGLFMFLSTFQSYHQYMFERSFLSWMIPVYVLDWYEQFTPPKPKFQMFYQDVTNDVSQCPSYIKTQPNISSSFLEMTYYMTIILFMAILFFVVSFYANKSKQTQSENYNLQINNDPTHNQLLYEQTNILIKKMISRTSSNKNHNYRGLEYFFYQFFEGNFAFIFLIMFLHMINPCTQNIYLIISQIYGYLFFLLIIAIYLLNLQNINQFNQIRIQYDSLIIQLKQHKQLRLELKNQYGSFIKEELDTWRYLYKRRQTNSNFNVYQVPIYFFIKALFIIVIVVFLNQTELQLIFLLLVQSIALLGRVSNYSYIYKIIYVLRMFEQIILTLVVLLIMTSHLLLQSVLQITDFVEKKDLKEWNQLGWVIIYLQLIVIIISLSQRLFIIAKKIFLGIKGLIYKNKKQEQKPENIEVLEEEEQKSEKEVKIKKIKSPKYNYQAIINYKYQLEGLADFEYYDLDIYMSELLGLWRQSLFFKQGQQIYDGQLELQFKSYETYFEIKIINISKYIWIIQQNQNFDEKLIQSDSLLVLLLKQQNRANSATQINLKRFSGDFSQHNLVIILNQSLLQNFQIVDQTQRSIKSREDYYSYILSLNSLVEKQLIQPNFYNIQQLNNEWNMFNHKGTNYVAQLIDLQNQQNFFIVFQIRDNRCNLTIRFAEETKQMSNIFREFQQELFKYLSK